MREPSPDTLTLIEISQEAFDEIAVKLRDRAWEHLFEIIGTDVAAIEMTGIALVVAGSVPMHSDPAPLPKSKPKGKRKTPPRAEATNSDL